MDVFYIILLTIFYLLLYVVYRLLMKKPNYWEKMGVPSAPYPIPYVGNVWPVLTQRTSFCELYLGIYKSFPNSSMVGLYNCGELELFLRDPELIKTILQTNFSSFQENAVKFDEVLDPLLKRNPITNVGERWRNDRAVLTNTMSTSKLKNMTITIAEVGGKFAKYLDDNVKKNGGVLETEGTILFSRFTAEVVACVGFGIDGQCFEKDTGTFVDMSGKMFDPSKLVALKNFISLLLPSFAQILGTAILTKEFDVYCRRAVSDVLKSRKQNGMRGNDFIQHVCDLYKTENGEIDEDFVTCHATSFYVDGYLTTSYTMSFLAYNIARHPEVQEKLRAEIKKVLIKHQGKLSYDAAQDMKYFDLVIKESMRVSPAISTMQKKCTEEFKLVGSDGIECIVKPGTRIMMSPIGLHHDPKYWTNPEDFQPERFEDEHKNNFPKFAYIPFGGGARICPGMRMAILQMKYAIATLLNNYSLTVSSKTKEPFVFDIATFFNVPQGGIWLNIKPL